MMNGHVCIVVPVYIRPMSIVEEQACIGVLLRCPEVDCYAFRLATDDEGVKERVLGFFPKLRRETLEQVLAWAVHDIEFTFGRERKGDKAAFHNLIRPRENIVRYGKPQALLSSDPHGELDGLYRRAVGGRGVVNAEK